jgi:hypothetical protein
MKHPLETENEELRKRIEATYDEIHEIDRKVSSYAILEMAEKLVNANMNSFSNLLLVNETTFNDIINWGNEK